MSIFKSRKILAATVAGLAVTGAVGAGIAASQDDSRTSSFFDAVAKYGDWASIGRMLDWGCGCGRVTRCFLRAQPELEVHGCGG